MPVSQQVACCEMFSICGSPATCLCCTVTVTVAVSPSSVAQVTVAVPGFSAVIRPSSSTERIAVSEEVKVTSLSDAFSGFTVATSWKVSPTRRSTFVWFTSMEVAGISERWMNTSSFSLKTRLKSSYTYLVLPSSLYVASFAGCIVSVTVSLSSTTVVCVLQRVTRSKDAGCSAVSTFAFSCFGSPGQWIEKS